MVTVRLTAMCVVVLLACSPAVAGDAAPKPRVLYFSQTEGFRHDTIPLGLKVLKELGAKGGAFSVDECTDCRLWSADYFAPYDAVVSYGSGELPLTDDNKTALLSFVRGGKGFVAVHSATYMCPRSKWPGYDEMVGAVFVNHPWSQKVRILVEDRKHPATAHLGEAFEITDEIYQHTAWSRDKTHVLMSIDTASVDLKNNAVQRKDGDFGMAWCHPYGKGRVFYTALGHRAEVWQDERFQKHLLHGVLWAAGKLDADIPLGFDGRTPR